MTKQEIRSSLNTLIADGTVFYQKLRHYHWNVKGPQFFALHSAFETMYDRWADHIDALAERLLTVGEVPIHTLRDVLAQARLQEDPEIPASGEMVRRLAADLERLINFLGDGAAAAEESGDAGTANLLEEIRDGEAKALWMLRATFHE